MARQQNTYTVMATLNDHHLEIELDTYDTISRSRSEGHSPFNFSMPFLAADSSPLLA
jgi:hypothetical protein